MTKKKESDSRVKATYKFPNGMVATLGYNGGQIPELQGAYSKELENKIRERSDERTLWEGY